MMICLLAAFTCLFILSAVSPPCHAAGGVVHHMQSIAKGRPNVAAQSVQVAPVRGKLTSCGSVPISVEWSPETWVFHCPETFYINFTAPVELNTGSVNASVWMAGIEQPVYTSSDKPFDCADVVPLLPAKYAHYFKCPFKKGDPLIIPGLTIPLDIPIVPPEGTFRIRAEVKTTAGEEFLCLEGDITLSLTKPPDHIGGCNIRP